KITIENDYELELVRFQQGEYLCRVGDDREYFSILVDGRAKVFTTVASGKTLLYSFYQDFGYIGDVELMMNKPFVAYIECLTQTYCIRISLKKYEGKLLEDTKFMRSVSQQLADKLDHISSNSCSNLLIPLENRLAGYIITVTTEDIFTENLTHLADHLGVSYRHLLRIMRLFCDKGYLGKSSNGYRILDLEMLEELGSNIY
ncbi:MAG TPA: cyclic nucleotide-binding domain-containing protein, partial [Lachnospiraceae bacterium]|nr:cyclic nucleotide-binding domain-containing protein [Lachnospiraceae bacterium]